MTTPILTTKLYRPPPRPDRVLRPRLIARLNQGLSHPLTLVSAPAGFGKTTLLSDWLAYAQRPVAWLSLDASDNDPARFLSYLVAAVQTVDVQAGAGLVEALQSPQPPPADAVLAVLLNDLAMRSEPVVLVLDDCHVIDAKPIDRTLTHLVEHLPPQLHLVLATREDPRLPLARLRARGQLSELRARDLRFTPAEVGTFLGQVRGLTLSPEDIAALEARTEGWIAGLHLAALSLQGHPDARRFIQAFTGSHRFVMDYLVEEVLQRQPASVQRFLLRTSILDRLCGPLCDAVLRAPAGAGQATLEALERANLFLVPLDDERRWYRYHQLFAELLRQRLGQILAASAGEDGSELAELHRRASQWYEEQGLELDAFQHAVAAQDFERTARLVEGRGIPRHFRDVTTAMLDWLGSLPTATLDARPALWVRYASLSLVNGQTTGVEEKLQAAERALQGAEPDDQTRDLIGRIAGARATVALTQYQVETMLVQSRRALEYLDPDNLSLRATANWTLGYAEILQGDRAAASRAFGEAVALGQASGDVFTTILATIGLGNIQELGNKLRLAAETYRRVLHLAGDRPLQVIYEAHVGLARICYEWNDLEAAERHGRQGLQLAQQYEQVIDRFIVCEVLLARLKLAQGDVTGAAAQLTEASRSARQQNFVSRMPEVAAAQVLVLLRQGHLAAAAQLAETHALPVSQARVHLAQADPAAALAVLDPWRRQVEARGWDDERLKVLVVQALALRAQGAQDQAVRVLLEALALAKPGGCIRTFVDEGSPMAQLLSAAAARGLMPDYIARLLAACYAEARQRDDTPSPPAAQPPVEPLSQRELEILRLIAQGRSNHEIGAQLFLALSTVKGYNRSLFDKLRVQRRTEAVARARELGLL